MVHLSRLQHQLRKCYPHLRKWKRKQNNIWDKKTKFVYQIRHFDTLARKIETELGEEPEFEKLKNYSFNRWYNFWSAQGLEQLFCRHPEVVPHSNPYDKHTDFWIDGIPFDHKTSVFPDSYPLSIAEVRHNPAHLLEWLYKNQSQQGRFHLRNRLFVVLYHREGKHQMLKSEMELIAPIIQKYLDDFLPQKLISISFPNQQQALCDCILVET